MGIKIADRQVDRLCIIDDDEGVRSTYVEEFYDSAFESFAQDEQVEDVDYFLTHVLKPTDAVISDHQLKKKKNYFPINGALVVSKCYEIGKPSVLVTKYDNSQMPEIRKHRKNIPIIINPSHFGEDAVYHGLEVCIKELKGYIRSDRKLHKTLIRIDAIEGNFIYIIIHGWDTKEAVSVSKDELPEHIKGIIEVDKRLHVYTNIGCENVNDLYFGSWEIK
jgi:hypothetical protein